MKTAILLCGLPREVGEVWPSFMENLYSRMPNPDVFIYTGESYNTTEFFKAVKPKAYVAEPQVPHPKVEKFVSSIGFYQEHRVSPTIQQFYGFKKAWELTEPWDYDLVVRTRPDHIYLRPITLDLLHLNQLNTFHSPSAHVMTTEIAIGPSHLMKQYCGVYDWLANDGQQYLTLKRNHRLDYTPKDKYNCDVLMVSYIVDYLGIKLAEPKLAAGTGPYDYYRIMYRHKNGLY